MADGTHAIRRIATWLATVVVATAVVACLNEPAAVGPAGEAAALISAGDSDLMGPVAQPLERPITVQVLDERSKPLVGVSVGWAVTAGGGSVSAPASRSDSLGRARTVWTLGPGAGIDNNVLTAAVPGLAPVIFTASGAASALGPWKHLAVGVEHTCGVTISGLFYCWGDNFFGEFGNGTTASSPTPKAGAPGLELSGFDVGYDFTCGLTPAGAAYCWGNNQTGALGDGLWDPNVLNPISHPNPIPVKGDLTFASLSVGWYHVCGLTPAGAAYCWGDNSTGQAGDGITARVRVTPEPVLGNLVFASISAGLWHTCGVSAEGAAYCWGGGDDPALGDGTSIARLSPVAVAGGIQFASISAGGTHTCGLDTQGVAYCWGQNAAGEVGDGTAEQRYSPVPVAGGLVFASISAGYDHTCGVSKAGVAYCWGHNESGELGVGDRDLHWVPTHVQTGVLFAGVVARMWYTCGWSLGGGAFCWGGGGSNVPVPVAGP